MSERLEINREQIRPKLSQKKQEPAVSTKTSIPSKLGLNEKLKNIQTSLKLEFLNTCSLSLGVSMSEKES